MAHFEWDESAVRLSGKPGHAVDVDPWEVLPAGQRWRIRIDVCNEEGQLACFTNDRKWTDFEGPFHLRFASCDQNKQTLRVHCIADSID